VQKLPSALPFEPSSLALFPFLPFPISRPLFFDLKPDLPWRLFHWRHECGNGLKDDLKLIIIFFLQGCQFASEVFMGIQHLPKADKRPHDLDVYLHNPFAA